MTDGAVRLIPRWLSRALGGAMQMTEDAQTRNEPHFVRMERSLVRIRGLGILLVAVAAPFAGFDRATLQGTYVDLVLSALYVGALQVYVIVRHPSWLSEAYVTSLPEAALISLAVFVSGGALSPFFPVYFMSVLTAALRYGVRAALIAACASSVLYGMVIAIHPNAIIPTAGELGLRFGFLILIGLLAGYLAREAQDNRAALAEELERTLELHRASSTLAEENARLSAALQQRLAELEQAQRQLIQSAKLAAIGELAANVAHEINNPLTAVLVNADLLDRELAPDDPHRQDLVPIRDEALRARGIVRNLLDFARQTPPTPELTDPRRIIDGVVPLVQKRARLAGVDIQRFDADSPLHIMVDVNQLKQVLINLLTNAIDAMPDGGRLVIETRATGGDATIEVHDTGTGILPAHRDRIFEPFFTTKPEVSGTGLGLSVSYGIVERHGGRITVESAPGRGSTFTVWLPLVLEAANVEAANVEAAKLVEARAN